MLLLFCAHRVPRSSEVDKGPEAKRRDGSLKTCATNPLCLGVVADDYVTTEQLTKQLRWISDHLLLPSASSTCVAQLRFACNAIHNDLKPKLVREGPENGQNAMLEKKTGAIETV